MSRRVFIFSLLSSSAVANVALAQTDSAAAEVLFQEGRALLRKGNIDEACPKLGDSFKLEPATGTLIALALCHEQQGKLASAWAEFTSAAGRARRESRPDREKLANEHAAALKPRLSTLTLGVPSALRAISGLEIRRDSVMLGESAWNSAMPIDGGEHVLRVSAPGYEAWETRLTVKNEGEAASVKIPELRAQSESGPRASSAPAEAGQKPPNATEPTQGASAPWKGLEWAGVVSASAGLVALGVGGYFLGSAVSKNSAADSYCNEANSCRQPGYDDRNTAYQRGNLATAFGIGGGVLVGLGATLFIVGRTRASGEQSGTPSHALALTSNGQSVTLRGTF